MPAPARYIVEIRHRSGNYLAEVDLDRADRGTILADLLTGQYEGAFRVYRLEDATAEFARSLCQRCVDAGEDLPLWLSELVENANEPLRFLPTSQSSAHERERLDDLTGAAAS
jgi:hypothetical protein